MAIIILRNESVTGALWKYGPQAVNVIGASAINSTGTYLALTGTQYIQIDASINVPWIAEMRMQFKILPSASGIQYLAALSQVKSSLANL